MRVVTALAHWVALSAGWPRRFIALLGGACGALAMAPIEAFPAMALMMSAAVWLIDGADRAPGDGGGSGWRTHLRPSLLSAAGTGWWWGLGYFAGGLWWLGAACLVEPEKFAWALPLAVFGVPAVLGLFTAFGFAVARLLWLPGAGRVLSLTIGLGLAEWLRSILFTGFPWNEYGMALGNILVLAQLGSLVGLHGLTLLTILLAAAPATLADDGLERGSLGSRLIPTGLALAGLAALAGFGALRLSDGHPASVAGVRLRIMQPDVAQDAAFTYANGREILRRYLDLSGKAGATGTGLADVTHLIWPESPFPFILSREPEAIDAITAVLPPGAVLITGAARAEGQPGGSPPPRYYNTIQILTADGSIVDTYDKVHLVPFGEYVPFDWILGRLGIEHFVDIPGGFSSGSRHKLIDAPGLPPIVPAICYEAIFPDEMVAGIPRSAVKGLILNVTDDSWFGNTSGPYQHFAQARLRAIEEGLPLIRAANTGISAIIDPYGRVLARLPVGAADVLDGPLPVALPSTVYGRFHDAVPLALFGLLLTAALILRYRPRRDIRSY